MAMVHSKCCKYWTWKITTRLQVSLLWWLCWKRE